MSADFFKSNLNLGKPMTQGSGMVPHSQSYLRLFFILKGQRSMIEATVTNIEDFLKQDPPKTINPIDLNALNTLRDLTNTLLNSTLGRLYPAANEYVQEIHNSILTTQISQDVSKIVIKALKATLAITRTLSLIIIQQNIPTTQAHSSSPLLPNRSSEFNVCLDDEQSDDDYIVCRICEQKVKASMFEEHTESCMMAYKNETNLTGVNTNLLELQKILITEFLNSPWPGRRDLAITNNLPILHLSLLLNRAFEIDPHAIDASDELQTILFSLDFFNNMSLPSKVNHQLVILKSKVNEKKYFSNAIREGEEFLSQTRKSPADHPSFNIPITIADFELITRISSGAFARVFLAKKKATGDIFAIKVQPKDDGIQKNQVKRVMAEKDILLQFNNPYIINFFYSFAGQNNLYLVMEYLPGGDLYSLLQNVSALDEDSARIYTIQIANAIGYLHKRGIIHRDIKPDNILIARDGSLRLTDFGLSYIGYVDRRVNEMSTNTGHSSKHKSHVKKTENESGEEKLVESRSLVGTPDYIAPEIVLNLPHTFTVDWWSLGVMVYEFVTGIPPFHGQTVEETRDLIMKGQYRRPNMEDDEVSEDCADFIAQLLQQNPKNRLGQNGVEEVLNHKWLKDVKVEDSEPPFIPELKSLTDTTYFEERYSPKGNDDSDIFADIQIAEYEKRVQICPSLNDLDPPELVNLNQSKSSPEIILSSEFLKHSDTQNALFSLQPPSKFDSNRTSFGSFGNGSYDMSSSPNAPLKTSSSYLLTSDTEDSFISGATPENDIGSFPAISVEQLSNQNRQLSQLRRSRHKQRASSFMADEGENCQSCSPPASSLGSKSFVGLNPISGGHRRYRKSFLSNFSSFDDSNVCKSAPKNKFALTSNDESNS